MNDLLVDFIIITCYLRIIFHSGDFFGVSSFYHFCLFHYITFSYFILYRHWLYLTAVFRTQQLVPLFKYIPKWLRILWLVSPHCRRYYYYLMWVAFLICGHFALKVPYWACFFSISYCRSIFNVSSGTQVITYFHYWSKNQFNWSITQSWGDGVYLVFTYFVETQTVNIEWQTLLAWSTNRWHTLRSTHSFFLSFRQFIFFIFLFVHFSTSTW